MKLTTIEAAGKSYPVEVDTYGYFRTIVAGTSIGAATLEGLTDLIRKKAAATKVRISIPYTDPRDLRSYTITGKHATTGKWLVKDQTTGKTEQSHTLPYDALRPLTSDELDELKLLQVSLQQASRNLDAARAKYRIPNLRDRAEAAIRDASTPNPTL